MKKIVKNENGIALVMALVMLVLLSILGAYALSTSSTELFIAGNYRNSQVAFYAADAGNEYGQKVNNGPNSLQPWWPGPASANVQTITGLDYTGKVNVKYLRTVRGAAGFDMDVVEGQYFDYYLVNSTGTGPTGATVNVESMIAQVR